MVKYSTIAAVIASVLISAAPAYAQSIEISERRAARIARDEGMDEVETIARRRGVFVVRGIDRRDNDMRVVIDRLTGDVLEVR